MITTAISEDMRAYSMAVAADSSPMNLMIGMVMIFLPGWNDSPG
jgi:hypothetical protein